MRRVVSAVLLAALIYPLTVQAKSFSSGGSSSGFSRPSPSVSRPASPSSTFKPLPQTRPSERAEAMNSYRRAERQTVVNNTTVVSQPSSGGGSILPWLFIGYAAGGGCDRKKEERREQ